MRAGWTLQPNFQFIVRPGGGATNPLSGLPGKALKNAEGVRPSNRAEILARLVAADVTGAAFTHR